MKLLQNILISILLMAGSLQAQEQNEPAINWLSFEQLSDSLETQPKPVLIFFHTDWCSYCKKMLGETFQDQKVIEKLNSEYYAVEFDAESVDTVSFDGVSYVSELNSKRTGKYHPLASILMGSKNRAVFPTTMILDTDFSVKFKKFNYLSIKQLLNIL
ncbi:hypothetical protein SMI01S_37570 [Sphingobacterium mizutaii NBRC 14946 = DSM 11724]|uniref:Thiol:disulfide interchange protein n=2 Tax=Sphingobacterium mizutaii TaxID=1010 RepID=A0AAJ5BZ66_9SPHI|nr:thioredoxin family protein [Sphingobacterium mizutaii]GEM70151.1 hypothetical protein SMI01S_37570 [Sphingobacterium mizutaii NBRC 14946 = DSM 11724]SDL37242.1 Thioredoxin-like [Sphingobacterium mizutaii]SNV43264.1 thiol:disulfide interchange protein precursor [Sphingobacterium mizutaii]